MVATVETGSSTDADIAGRRTSHLVAWLLLGSTPRTWVSGKVMLMIETHVFHALQASAPTANYLLSCRTVLNITFLGEQ